METEQAPPSAGLAHPDEVDLIELFKTLWQQRLLIIAITAVITAVAATFAFLVTPEYEAKAGVLPPRMGDIVGYNLGRKEVGLSRFTVSEVYAMFKTNLLSGSLRRTFFRDAYLPVLASDKRAEAQDKLWEGFNQMLTVQVPKENRPDLYEVMIKYESPELAAEWVNLYIDMAVEKTERDIHDAVDAEVEAKTQVIERQIDGLRATAQKRRADRLIRLRDALVVAEAVGLDAPIVVTGKVPSGGDLAQFIDGNLMYMRGAKAIRAELGILEKRENDDPYINELRDLENKLDFLEKINVTPGNVSVFTFDSNVEVPETPVKPKKAIIIALGVIVGSMLGIFSALIRNMVEKRKVKVG